MSEQTVGNQLSPAGRPEDLANLETDLLTVIGGLGDLSARALVLLEFQDMPEDSRQRLVAMAAHTIKQAEQFRDIITRPEAPAPVAVGSGTEREPQNPVTVLPIDRAAAEPPVGEPEVATAEEAPHATSGPATSTDSSATVSAYLGAKAFVEAESVSATESASSTTDNSTDTAEITEAASQSDQAAPDSQIGVETAADKAGIVDANAEHSAPVVSEPSAEISGLCRVRIINESTVEIDGKIKTLNNSKSRESAKALRERLWQVFVDNPDKQLTARDFKGHVPITNLAGAIAGLAANLTDSRGVSIVVIDRATPKRNEYYLRRDIRLLRGWSPESSHQEVRHQPIPTPAASKPAAEHRPVDTVHPDRPEIQQIAPVAETDDPKFLRRGLVKIMNSSEVNAARLALIAAEGKRPRPILRTAGTELLIDGKPVEVGISRVELLNHLFKNTHRQMTAEDLWRAGYGQEELYDGEEAPSAGIINQWRDKIEPIVRDLNRKVPGLVHYNLHTGAELSLGAEFVLVVNPAEYNRLSGAVVAA